MTATNYFNTFIEVAEDCLTTSGEIPPIKGDKKSVATLQFEMLSEHPYDYTSGVFVNRSTSTLKSEGQDGMGASQRREIAERKR